MQQVSDSKRQALFETFYSLGDCEKQKVLYLLKCRGNQPTKTRLGEDNKPISQKWSLSRGFVLT